jgi:hypothetical protein
VHKELYPRPAQSHRLRATLDEPHRQRDLQSWHRDEPRPDGITVAFRAFQFEFQPVIAAELSFIQISAIAGDAISPLLTKRSFQPSLS